MSSSASHPGASGPSKHQVYATKGAKITINECLGKKGREGSIYRATSSSKQIVAKMFRKNKNSDSLYKEYSFLRDAGKLGIAPKTYGYMDEDGKKYIFMEEMHETLYEILKKNNYELSTKYQRRIIEIFKILDKNKIYHADSGPLNFMTNKNGQLFIIDFGISQKIDKNCIEKYGEEPNINNGIPFFILKTRLIYKKFLPKILLKKIYL